MMAEPRAARAEKCPRCGKTLSPSRPDTHAYCSTRCRLKAALCLDDRRATASEVDALMRQYERGGLASWEL